MFDIKKPSKNNKKGNVEALVRDTKKIVSSTRRYPGQKIWELELTKMVMKEVFTETDKDVIVDFSDGSKTIRKKLKRRENCLYCFSATKRTAIKKFSKEIGLVLEIDSKKHQ